jgi:hypothetical protein
MGMFHETERMIKHRQRCDVCKAATETRKEEGYEWEVVHYADFCDLYGDMFNHVIDFEMRGRAVRGQQGHVRQMRRQVGDLVEPFTNSCETEVITEANHYN